MVDLDPLTGEPEQLRSAYSCFPSGVTAVCALSGGRPRGIAASSFTPVSLNPPLVSVCVQNTSTTWPRLRTLPRLGVSVLGAGQDTTATRLAAKHGDRFADVPWQATPDGGVLVHQAVLWLDCSVHSEVSAGDHIVALLQVHGLRSHPDRVPLVFHGSRFRQLVEV
ncbi:flavin reductase family protein [Pseudonocardia sp. C8]|uniref:flavin reductase family protein n=1 Tax=Pseudonocardia sp. C8 TaxID=2762759 RepID=UPI00351C76AC